MATRATAKGRVRTTKKTKRSGPGQPTKLTQERREKILQLIRTGSYRETACAAAGIDSRTLRMWLKKAAEGHSTYTRFAREMDEAEAQAESAHVLKITKASRDDWRAAAWILSKKHRNRWGDKIQVEVQQRIDDLFQVVEDVLGSDSAAAVLEEIIRRDGSGSTEEAEG